MNDPWLTVLTLRISDQATAVKAEGSPEKVAQLYEVPLAAVRDAVSFEQQLAN